jgi:hypothetical protein
MAFRSITVSVKLLLVGLLIALVPLAIIIPAFITHPSQVYAVQDRVDLLTADTFAVLAGSAISDTGTTAIIGDVGLSGSGGGADITGLTCAEVTGTIYDTNGGYTGGGGGSTACLVTDAGLLTTAKNDLTTAYNDAAGRTTTQYDSAAGTFGITGTLTLDGQGNADSVFIFKMASTLITASSSQVVLINGAQACNVYWQVGSSATLGTSTILVGNVLALTSITDNGGSTVYGRLLARNGATTLNNTTIIRQACASGSSSSSSSSSSDGSSSGSSGGSGSCPAITNIAPIIIESRRIDADSIFLSWGPYSGIDTFNVRYGLTNGSWLYNTNVTGFSTTLNDLPANQPIWVQVAATNSCSIGTYGESMLVGGPALPNTGFVSDSTKVSWYIPAGIFVLLSLLLSVYARTRIKYFN